MKYPFTLFLCITAFNIYSQNVGIGTNAPQNKLHVAGGLRIDSLANKKDSGLILHNKEGDVYSLKLTGKTTDVLRGDGTFATSAAVTDAWLLGGNAGTDSNTNFLGTTDNKPLRFRINNQPFGSLGRNISLGRTAILNNQSVKNIAIGDSALRNVFKSNENIAIGHQAMFGFTGDQRSYYPSGENLAIGVRALYSSGDGDNNTAIGYEALYSENIASDLTAIGHHALRNNRGGVQNTAVGFLALRSNLTGVGQTAVGYGALSYNGRGSYNTAVGANAMGFTSETEYIGDTLSSGNTAVGFNTLYYCLGANNTAMGVSALYQNTTGKYNVANGYQALMNNTVGSDNQAFGYKVLFSNSVGSFNTGTGFRTLYQNTSGNNNTASGYLALTSNTTGSNNTAFGYYADVTSGTLTNATAIGYNAKVNASNKVRIGNASVTVIEGQVPFTTPSDGRFKFNVREDVQGLDFILKLRPVTYQFDVKKFDGVDNVSFASQKNDAYEKAARIRRTGFIAQEVEKAAEGAHYNFSGVLRPGSKKEHYSLSYESFVVPLVKAVQEQQAIINMQDQKIAEQEEKIMKLYQIVDGLIIKIDKVAK